MFSSSLFCLFGVGKDFTMFSISAADASCCWTKFRYRTYATRLMATPSGTRLFADVWIFNVSDGWCKAFCEGKSICWISLRLRFYARFCLFLFRVFSCCVQFQSCRLSFVLRFHSVLLRSFCLCANYLKCRCFNFLATLLSQLQLVVSWWFLFVEIGWGFIHFFVFGLICSWCFVCVAVLFLKACFDHWFRSCLACRR